MIRLAKPGDLPRLLEIYDAGRAFMRATGNMTQWEGGYPDEATLRDDIARGNLYAMEDDGGIYAVFALIGGEDPTYGVIDGAWHSDTPYCTIHRIAGDGSHRGVLAEAVRFAEARYDHLRVDTHADNLPMQRAIAKCGFAYAGVIYLANGDPRRAYDRIQ